MNALAPQAEEIRVYEAPNGGSGFFDMFNELNLLQKEFHKKNPS